MSNPLPEVVQIGPYRYAVVREPDPKDDRGHRLWGQARHERHEIAITTDEPPDRARETLFHEVLHCVAAAGAVHLKEREVVVLSAGLVDALVRNPHLTRLFLEGE